MNLAFQYIDLIWLPITFFAVDKLHRKTALLFVVGCIFLMRLQVELMASIGYPNGVLKILDMHAFYRGVFVYTLGYIIYLAFMHFWSTNDKSIVLASSIGLFFMVFFASSVVLML